MASATTYLLSALAGLVALFSLYVYLFGIPPQVKRELEERALQTMGENKASAVLKDQISKMPESDQQNVKDLKEGLSNLGGGALKNPLGDNAGDFADDATKDFTGR